MKKTIFTLVLLLLCFRAYGDAVDDMRANDRAMLIPIGDPDAIDQITSCIDLYEAGDFESALAALDGFESSFPSSILGIAWARYWRSNCLLALDRLDEVYDQMRPVITRIQSAQITEATQVFLFAHQFIRVLPDGDLKATGVEIAIQKYETLLSPRPEFQEKAGYLYFFDAQMEMAEEHYGQAYLSAETAWGIGDGLNASLSQAEIDGMGVNILHLRSWGRFIGAEAALAADNMSVAASLIQSCSDNGYLVTSTFRGKVWDLRIKARIKAGQLAQARSELLAGLENITDYVESHGLARGAIRYYVALRGTEDWADAIAPLSIARTCYSWYPGINVLMERAWYEMVGESDSKHEMVEAFKDSASGGSDLLRASIMIQAADLAVDIPRLEIARELIQMATETCNDPRIRFYWRIVDAKCNRDDRPVALAEIYLDEYLAGNSAVMLTDLIESARTAFWQTGLSTSYGDWLNENQTSLPGRVYTLEMIRWLIDCEGDYASAYVVINDFFLSNDILDGDWEPHAEKIICLFLNGNDSAGQTAVTAMLDQLPDTGSREMAYFSIANRLWRGRPDIAIQVVDAFLVTSQNKVLTDDVILIKAYSQAKLGQYSDASTTLSTLLLRDMDIAVCTGLLYLARIEMDRLSDESSARSAYDDIMTDLSLLPFDERYKAVWEYVRFEVALQNYDSARQIVLDNRDFLQREDALNLWKWVQPLSNPTPVQGTPTPYPWQ